jgi:hypothetical protein
MDVRRDLERIYHAQTIHNLRCLDELDSLVAAMRGEGVEPIVLKGAALSRSHYASPGLRTLSDLDLLIREDEIAPLHALLVERGYRQIDTGVDYAVHHHTAPYLAAAGYPRVELHVGLGPGREVLEVEGLRSRSEPRGHVRALCPEDQLLHCCLHLAGAGAFVAGVKDLCDIDRLLRDPDFDASALCDRAESAELGRTVYYSTRLAARALNTPVPVEIRRRLRRHRLPRFEDLLLRAIARAYVTTVSDPERFFGQALAKGWGRALLSSAPPRERRRAMLRALRGYFASGGR